VINEKTKELLPCPLKFSYKNWRGEVSQRTVRPISIRFGATIRHGTEQWLMLAFDQEKQAHREFAMTDMSEIT